MEDVMVMSNNLVELSDIEMLEIDGGFDWWKVLGNVCAAVCKVGISCVSPPLAMAARGAIWAWRTYKVWNTVYKLSRWEIAE